MTEAGNKPSLPARRGATALHAGADMVDPILACPDCGAIQTTPACPKRGQVLCRVCDRVLEDSNGRSLDAALACSLATLLMLFPANFLPLMTVHVAGISTSTHLASGLLTAWYQGWPVVALVLASQGIVLPFARFGLLSLTLGAIRFGVHGQWVGRCFRYSEWLDRWAMADVLAIGFGVGYGRVASQIPVSIEAGGWCFLASAFLTVFTRAAVQRRAVWRRLAMPPRPRGADIIACTSCDVPLPAAADGKRCPRCAARVHRRLPGSFQACAALVAASWILIPIAYWLPMSEFWAAGTPHPHSVLDGIILLFSHGFWPLGILIACTSVGVPIAKLAVLTWVLVSIRHHSTDSLRLKTKAFRVVDALGRWSNLDPFTVMIFAPMVQFGQLAHINVMGGSFAFLSMVVMSMIAAHVLDTRLLWDATAASPDPKRSNRRMAMVGPDHAAAAAR